MFAQCLGLQARGRQREGGLASPFSASSGSSTEVHTRERRTGTERPELADGHTFSLSAESTLFRLQDSPCTMFPPDDLFHNPYGMWMLH